MWCPRHSRRDVFPTWGRGAHNHVVPVVTHALCPEFGGAEIRVAGDFSDTDADRLFAMAIAVDADGPVTLDFRDARTVDDHALVKLVQGYVGRLTIVNLSEHHHRLLQYIGLEQR